MKKVLSSGLLILALVTLPYDAIANDLPSSCRPINETTLRQYPKKVRDLNGRRDKLVSQIEVGGGGKVSRKLQRFLTKEARLMECEASPELKRCKRNWTKRLDRIRKKIERLSGKGSVKTKKFEKKIKRIDRQIAKFEKSISKSALKCVAAAQGSTTGAVSVFTSLCRRDDLESQSPLCDDPGLRLVMPKARRG